MNDLILHIGTEKTGTKSIQLTLCCNQKKLLEHGVYYPTDASLSFVSTTAHWPVAAAFSEAKGFVPPEKQHAPKLILRDLENCISSSPAQNVLLSAEPISAQLVKKSQVKSLRKATKKLKARVSILVYLRPQADFFVSSVSTYLKSGQILPLTAEGYCAMNGIEIDYRNAERFNYLRMYRLWSHQFGREHMIVRPYAHHGEAHVIDFLAAIGVENITLDHVPSEQNRSLSLEAALLLNEFNQALSCKEYRSEHVHKLQNALTDVKGNRKIDELVEPGTYEKIAELYSASNSQLASLLGWEKPLPTCSRKISDRALHNRPGVSPETLHCLISQLKQGPSAEIMDAMFKKVPTLDKESLPLLREAREMWIK